MLIATVGRSLGAVALSDMVVFPSGCPVWVSLSTISLSNIGPPESVRSTAVFFPQAVANFDSGQVQHQNQDNQYKCRSINQWAGRFHIGALETHIVDMEAQVH